MVSMPRRGYDTAAQHPGCARRDLPSVVRQTAWAGTRRARGHGSGRDSGIATSAPRSGAALYGAACVCSGRPSSRHRGRARWAKTPRWVASRSPRGATRHRAELLCSHANLCQRDGLAHQCQQFCSATASKWKQWKIHREIEVGGLLQTAWPTDVVKPVCLFSSTRYVSMVG